MTDYKELAKREPIFSLKLFAFQQHFPTGILYVL